MSEILRVGTIGAGIGAAYIAGFQKQPGVEVSALCARTPVRLKLVAERYNIPRTYTDYQAMLDTERLDIVAIATPNYLHHPMTLSALEAGKHVLCEKPLALNVGQAGAMLEAAEQHGRKHFVPFTYRFLPAALYMKEILDAGFVGQVYHAYVRFHIRGWGDPSGPMRWQFQKEQAGSGVLGNVGSHAVYLIQWWLGRIQRVSATLTTAVKERVAEGGHRVTVQLDDSCAITGELEDGVPVVFDISQVAMVERIKLEAGVFGSEGSLIFLHESGAQDAVTGRILAMRKNEKAPALLPIPSRLTGEFLDMADFSTPPRSCFRRMTAEFVNAIREDRPAEPNFHDGLQVQKVLDAVLTAASEQRRIPV